MEELKIEELVEEMVKLSRVNKDNLRLAIKDYLKQELKFRLDNDWTYVGDFMRRDIINKKSAYNTFKINDYEVRIVIDIYRLRTYSYSTPAFIHDNTVSVSIPGMILSFELTLTSTKSEWEEVYENGHSILIWKGAK